MKRFLLRVLLLAALCVALLLGLSQGYLALLNTDYERNEDLTLQFNNIPGQVDIACFGSSHAGNAFQPARYYGKGAMFNFYMQQQSPVMDAALYRVYRDHLAPGAEIVFTLTYFSLYDNETQSLDNMKRYANFLPVNALPNLKTKAYRLFRVVDFSFEPVLSALEGKTAVYEPMKTTTLASSYTQETLEEMGQKRADVFLSLIGNAEIDPEIDAALRWMLADCIERGYRPVLVTTPCQDVFTKHFSDAFLATFYAQCTAYAEEFGIPYFDYSHDARFAETPAYFVDTDHLSSDGSEVFMKIFFSDLAAYYPED